MPSAAYTFHCQRKIVYCLGSSNKFYLRLSFTVFIPHQVEI